MYFEGLFSDDGKGAGLICSVSCGTGCDIDSSSLVSDAASPDGKNRADSRNQALRGARSVGFEKRRSNGASAIDGGKDDLEDTASSPLNEARS